MPRLEWNRLPFQLQLNEGEHIVISTICGLYTEGMQNYFCCLHFQPKAQTLAIDGCNHAIVYRWGVSIIPCVQLRDTHPENHIIIQFRMHASLTESAGMHYHYYLNYTYSMMVELYTYIYHRDTVYSAPS